VRWIVAQPGPSWSVHDVYRGWVEALRELGEDVHEFNLDDRLALYDHALIDVGEGGAGGELTLRKALNSEQSKELAVNGLAAMLFKVNPDILFIICGFFVPPQMLEQARRYGTRVVILHTEEPYELDRELSFAQHADLNLITDPTHLNDFLAVAPTVFAPHCYRPSVHHPGPALPELAVDFAFVGTAFGSRRWFFEKMHHEGAFTGRDVLLAGNWQGVTEADPLHQYLGTGDPEKCVDNHDTAQIYRSAKVGMNLYRREANKGGHTAGIAISPREVEMAACGMFFLRDPRPEGDEVFRMLPTFGTPEEATERLEWALEHPSQCESLAVLAREAIADRTFRNSAVKLLRLFDREPVTT
jgi:spore maturation protein CgeB